MPCIQKIYNYILVFPSPKCSHIISQMQLLYFVLKQNEQNFRIILRLTYKIVVCFHFTNFTVKNIARLFCKI